MGHSSLITPERADQDLVQFGTTLPEQRQAVYTRLLQGASGAEVLAAFTEFVDGLIIGRYRNAVRRGDDTFMTTGHQGCCLVALGGYGRRELAPYSDIDLMFLYKRELEAQVPFLIKEVLHHLWDLGFQVGHSVRTIYDCLELAGQDVSIRTAMMEARYLAGSADLFQEFQTRYRRRIVMRGVDRFIDAKRVERQKEYEKFGETVYLLEPNVKKSKGGLRDLHLLQWIGMAKYQAGTVQELTDRGLLSRHDSVVLTEAREFLWRVRAFLHFQAGMAQEILTFDEQVRLAERFGFHDQPHLLAVEQFMQLYYRHTTSLQEICSRFVDRCQTVPLWTKLRAWLPASHVEHDFVMSGGYLTVPDQDLTRVLDSPVLLFRLFEVAQARRVSIDIRFLDQILQHVSTIPDVAFRSPEVNRSLLRILSGMGPVADTLEAMHRAHLLEKVIPAFARVRGLMQFNQYHKYTVDEHSLLAVRSAELLGNDSGPLGVVYREIPRKDLLHLSLLLHDLGKGHEEDHSEVGKRLAEETAERLGLNEQESSTLSFLVHRHLLMAHTAFRRDPYDDKVLLPFARAVANPEVLKHLLILTAADITAVGPGVFTKWKESLLIQLYLRTLQEVSGEKAGDASVARIKEICAQVHTAAALSSCGVSEAWIAEQLGQFPARYLYGTPPERIAVHLAAIRDLQPGQVQVLRDVNEAVGACEYTVLTFDGLTPGIFSKIAGVLAAKGLHILDAQIVTRLDGIVVDTFQVSDPDYTGAPSTERLHDVAESVSVALTGHETVDELIKRSQRLTSAKSLPAGQKVTEVQVDNDTSSRYSIIDVFAEDRQGLLYVMANTIFRLGLSVHAARISTRLDQVADVFYVTDTSGEKILDPSRLEVIRTTIKESIDRVVQRGSGESVEGSSDTSSQGS